MKAKVYYNTGQGFSEDEARMFDLQEDDGVFSLTPDVSENTKEIKFDPVELVNCMITNFKVIDEDGCDLTYSAKSNGFYTDGEWYFLNTTDPWYVLPYKNKKLTFTYRLTSIKPEEIHEYDDIFELMEKKKNNFFRKAGRKLLKIIKGDSFADDIKGIQYNYNEYLFKQQASPEELEAQSQQVFDNSPLISILVPTYKTPEKVLREMIDSVVAQSYGNWELVLADGSMDDSVFNVVKTYDDKRIVYKRLDDNKGISGNTNEALAMAKGQYIGLLDHDDTVEADLLYEIVRRLQQDVPEDDRRHMTQDKVPDMLYTDEDFVDEHTFGYSDPNLKPDFSIDLLRSHNYITHFFCVKKSILDQVGGFDSKYDGAQDYDLILRCSEVADCICHIPKVLYHWRQIAGSTADDPSSKMYCYEAGLNAVKSHLSRQGVEAEVEYTQLWGCYHTIYKVQGNPLVSIIIANKDLSDTLDRCIRSIENKSTYRNFEIIVVENNSIEEETFRYYESIQKEFSNVKVVKWDKEFNYSAINNFGVEHSNGDYILLLNNDTELISETAIQEMLGICQRTEVGAVGAKLLFPDDTLQHAGVALGYAGYAGHVFSGSKRNAPGFKMRQLLNCNYSAVTAACLMTKRQIFSQVGGLSEDFKVACNDVDFCLKIRMQGYMIVYGAFCEWYHYESKSRGYEDTPEKKERFDREVAHFREYWGEYIDAGDPFYNLDADKFYSCR